MKKLLAGFFILGISSLLIFGGGTDAHAQTITSSRSENWSGYIATGGNYTAVSGSWTVAPVLAAPTSEADATWVGIGGAAGKDLIQAGTQALVNNNQVNYYAWYELLPSDAVTIPLAVSPGNSISVSLTESSPNIWQLVFKNNSTGQTYTNSLSYSSSQASAEWVEEAPVENGSFVALDNFGTVNFTNAAAVSNGAYGSPRDLDAYGVTLENGNTILAAPSPLGNDGASFSVMRENLAIMPTTIPVVRYIRLPSSSTVPHFRRMVYIGRRVM